MKKDEICFILEFLKIYTIQNVNMRRQLKDLLNEINEELIKNELRE